jgi:hypothetical protein
MAFDISTELEGLTLRMSGYGSAMNYVIFDLQQEYCGPAPGSAYRAIFFGRGRGAAGFVLPRSKLPNHAFADFGGGGHFG